MNDERRQRVKEIILNLQDIESDIRELLRLEEKALNDMTEHFTKTEHTYEMEGNVDTLRRSVDSTVHLIGYLNHVLK